MLIHLLRAATVALTLVASSAAAQGLSSLNPLKGTETSVSEKVIDPLGRETPRGLMYGYIQAVASGDFEAAGEYLDLPKSSEQFRKTRATRLAEDFSTLLNRAGALNPNWQLSNSQKGHIDDSPDLNREVLGTIDIERKRIPILAIRQESDAGGMIWKISFETLSKVEELLLKTQPSLVDRMFPGQISTVTYYGIPANHFVLAASVGGILWLMVTLGTSLALSVLVRTAGDAAHLWAKFARQILFALAAFIAAGLLIPALEIAGISIILRGFLSPIIDVAQSLTLAWLAYRVVDSIARMTSRRALKQGYLGSISVISLARRGAKITVVFLALIVVLDAIGVDLTAGLAALGIGGIAIALGSQKTIEHLVGGVTIVADRVVNIDDFCRFGTTLGTIEDIGIRSTRIRTLSRTVLTVPNGVFSSGEIENFTDRDKFLMKKEIKLRAGTTAPQIREILKTVFERIEQHPAVDKEDRRVRFTGFIDGLPTLEIFAYLFAEDWAHFLEFQQDLLLGVMDDIEAAGSDSGLPTRAVYSMPTEPSTGAMPTVDVKELS